jgi:tripartite-type tricarboxylate transporter receptor subunit TctC
MNPQKISIAAALITAVCAAQSSMAQTYPTKPVHMIVPFAPGGGADIAARAITPKLSEFLGQSVVVENRAGGNSHIGSRAVAKSAPDGYTILLCAVGTVATTPHLDKLDYDPLKELAPVALVGDAGLGIAVNASVPVNSLTELVKYANAQPKGIFYSVSALGTMPHLAAELFKIRSGINWSQVVYKGAGPAATALVAGDVPAASIDIGALMPHAKSGKVKILAVTGSRRAWTAPEIPTAAEAGFPGYAADAWIGIFAPAATPAPIVTRLNADINRSLESPETRKGMQATGTEPRPVSVEEFRRQVAEDHRKWGEVIRKGNIKVE